MGEALLCRVELWHACMLEVLLVRPGRAELGCCEVDGAVAWVTEHQALGVVRAHIGSKTENRQDGCMAWHGERVRTAILWLHNMDT